MCIFCVSRARFGSNENREIMDAKQWATHSFLILGCSRTFCETLPPSHISSMFFGFSDEYNECNIHATRCRGLTTTVDSSKYNGAGSHMNTTHHIIVFTKTRCWRRDDSNTNRVRFTIYRYFAGCVSSWWGHSVPVHKHSTLYTQHTHTHIPDSPLLVS